MGRADRLFTRGTEHLERWHATQHVDDLNASIAAFTKLDSILPAGDGRRAVVDWQLGNALACRAEQEQSIAALDDAIARLRRAAAAPEAAGNEDFDGCHLILGKAIASRLDFSGPGKPTDAELFDLVKTATDSLAVAARSQSEY